MLRLICLTNTIDIVQFITCLAERREYSTGRVKSQAANLTELALPAMLLRQMIFMAILAFVSNSTTLRSTEGRAMHQETWSPLVEPALGSDGHLTFTIAGETSNAFVRWFATRLQETGAQHLRGIYPEHVRMRG